MLTAGQLSEPVPPVASWVSTRLELQAAVRTASIGTLDIQELEAVQITPLSILGADCIEIPAEWMPAGRVQRLSQRILRITNIASERHPLGSPGYDAARLSVLRILLALWLTPIYRDRRAVLLKPSTFHGRARLVIGFAQSILASEDANPAVNGVFSNLSKVQTRALIDEWRPRSGSTQLPALITGLDQLRSRGAIQDWLPEVLPVIAPGVPNGKPPLERSRRDGTIQVERKHAQPWQPLPDEFVSESGWRCLWIMENLGPGLISCLPKLTSQRLADRAPHANALMDARRAVIMKHEWKSADGTLIRQLPFTLQFTRTTSAGNSSLAVTFWPPSSYDVFSRVVGLLQASHMFIVLMATAGRWSEVSSLNRNCLQPIDMSGVVERVQGRTYKYVDQIGGALRDWPLHPTARAALLQQISLAETMLPGSEALWVKRWYTSGIAVGQLHGANDALQSLAAATSTQALLHGTSFHPHRFRKTIARLAALALVGAPKILMDLFGHKSIEMTLRYILSDPALAAEVQEVARARVIMLGQVVIESARENGGAAGRRLRDYLDQRKGQRGEKALGVEDLREAAEILTLNGRGADIVRPGVLCTKRPGEAGPCTKNVGHPDPSRCRIGCDHRLELAAARQDAERNVEISLEMLQKASVADDEMQWAFWRGQLLHQVRRFQDLVQRYAARSEKAVLFSKGVNPWTP